MTWDIKNGKLSRDFVFDNYDLAFNFVSKISAVASTQNHHPEIHFGWGFANIEIFTHEKNTITDKDYELAKAIDELLQ